MIESVLAFTLFDKVLAVIGLIRSGKKERSGKVDRALMALYTALAETKAYITEQEGGAPRDRQRESQLARLWQTASIPLREIEPELAERCFEKGGFWMDSDTWDAERIRSKGIAIESVFEATRSVLFK
ncbi:MAG: hypothetical protein ACYC6T_05880 [Thermoleophilia bacterium]